MKGLAARCTLGGLVALGGLLSFAEGDPVGGVPSGLERVRVGEWVTFRQSGGGERVSFWRFSAVGEEVDSNGKKLLWLENEVGEHPDFRAPLARMKFLVSRRTGLAPGGVVRLIVAQGTDDPREVSGVAASILPWGSGQSAAPVASDKSPKLPLATSAGSPRPLVTYAGSVVATPIEVLWKNRTLWRFWVADAVPILRLARIDLVGFDHSWELFAFGEGASPLVPFPDPSQPALELQAAPAKGR